MFYYDDKVIQYQKALEYDKLLEYLESIIDVDPNKIAATIIGYAWYFAVEGDVGVVPKQYNFKKYLSIWKKYIDTIVSKPFNSKLFFVAGFTLSMHGFYIDSHYGETKYGEKGIELLKMCLAGAREENVGKLAENFLLNEKSKKTIFLKDHLEVCNALFCNKSLLDEYFIEFYSRKAH